MRAIQQWGEGSVPSYLPPHRYHPKPGQGPGSKNPERSRISIALVAQLSALETTFLLKISYLHGLYFWIRDCLGRILLDSWGWSV
jgi:hypothetical protein